MKTTTKPNPTELHATIKLGIDAHAKGFYVARQLDGAAPQQVQKMTLEEARPLTPKETEASPKGGGKGHLPLHPHDQAGTPHGVCDCKKLHGVEQARDCVRTYGAAEIGAGKGLRRSTTRDTTRDMTRDMTW